MKEIVKLNEEKQCCSPPNVCHMMMCMYRIIKSPVTVFSIQSSTQQVQDSGFRVLSFFRGPCIDGIRFMSSRFGNCDQVWTCSTGHDDASSGWTLEWVAVVKSHDCLHSVKIQPGGLFGAVGAEWGWRGEQGPCVQFSPSMRRRLRPRWGWIPCCSACLEAETT